MSAHQGCVQGASNTNEPGRRVATDRQTWHAMIDRFFPYSLMSGSWQGDVLFAVRHLAGKWHGIITSLSPSTPHDSSHPFDCLLLLHSKYLIISHV